MTMKNDYLLNTIVLNSCRLIGCKKFEILSFLSVSIECSKFSTYHRKDNPRSRIRTFCFWWKKKQIQQLSLIKNFFPVWKIKNNLSEVKEIFSVKWMVVHLWTMYYVVNNKHLGKNNNVHRGPLHFRRWFQKRNM